MMRPIKVGIVFGIFYILYLGIFFFVGLNAWINIFMLPEYFFVMMVVMMGGTTIAESFLEEPSGEHH